MPQQQLSVLVTGCAGFIGSKVVERLINDGHLVAGLDNLNGAYDVRLKEWRLNQLRSLSNFEFHAQDLNERDAVIQTVEKIIKAGTGRLDAIVNLAAMAGVRQSVLDPASYYQTNVSATLNLLEICRERAIPKFILSSTSSVYGDSKGPFHEVDSATDQPLSPYAASKKAAENLSYVYHHLNGLNVSVLRYFTVYGPAGRPDMSIFRFVQRISEGRTITVYGDGTQQRDFTFVEDIARGTVAALALSKFQVINLGSDRPVPLHKVIGIIEDLVGRKALIDYQPRHPSDVSATWADIGKARDLLEWTPQITLESGLERTVAWYHENRDWAKHVETGGA